MAAFTSGDWYVRDGHEQDFVNTWHDFAERSNDRFGGGWGLLLHDKEDPKHFTSVGMWADERTIEQWRESDEFKDGMQMMRSHLELMQVHSFEQASSVGRVAMPV